MKRLFNLFLVLLAGIVFSGCSLTDILENDYQHNDPELTEQEIAENDYYSSKDDVALYLHLYRKLPDNYLTKQEARELGWEASKGNLWEVTDQKIIGGDRFGNREGKLPDQPGRQYYEADVNYEGGYRGAERIVYSNDGLIYYTDDHYETFTLLYGEE